MKKVLSVIFVCFILMLTSCSDKTNNTEQYSTYETKKIEESMEETIEDTSNIEISDEEYLINLGKRLKLGMTAQEVIEEIGEPDMDLGSGVTYLCYCQGDCTLWVCVFGKVSEVSVYNDKTDKTTYIYSIYEGETETAE